MGANIKKGSILDTHFKSQACLLSIPGREQSLKSPDKKKNDMILIRKVVPRKSNLVPSSQIKINKIKNKKTFKRYKAYY